MFRRAVMKLTTFLVFAFFCCLLVIKIDKELTTLYARFGKTYWVMVRGHECISIILVMGMIVIVAFVTEIVKWIFKKEEEAKKKEDKAEE